MTDKIVQMPGTEPDPAEEPAPPKNNVIPLGGVTRYDLPPERVLDSAKEHLKSVVILGIDHEGKHYFASTIADGGEVLWLLEKLKQRLMNY